jgi:hypothetical protein
MKWFTLKSSPMRCNGDSRSRYEACVQDRNVVCEAGDHGTTLSCSSLHKRVTGWYSVEEEVAFDARAADQMSYTQVSVRKISLR